jgi:ATP-dependent exoDNAse (exonuclease V) beta subunit
MKEKILEILNAAFGKFKFFPEDHHYELNNKKVGISVTKLIEEYTNEFDKKRIAIAEAKKTGKTIKEVLEEWKYKNDFAKAKGTTCHEYAQSLWNGEHWDCDNFDFSLAYGNAVYKIKNQADEFYQDYGEIWEHVKDELVVGSEEYDIASAIDHIFIKKSETFRKKIILVDYKTNTYIRGYNKDPFIKPMKAPLNHLNDDTFTHYKLQLSIYKYLIEKYTDLEVEEMYIIYFTEINDNYEKIEIPYLKKEVEDILEWRILE